MKYCPECGNILISGIEEETAVNRCSNCSYIDWNNWVYVACVVVAFTPSNEFVMVKLKGKEEGKITFPGGYREIGETLEEAAIREFYEETGMRINNVEFYKSYTLDKLRLVWLVYQTKVDQVSFTENNEVSELLLVSPNQLIDRTFLRGRLTEGLYNDLLSKWEKQGSF